MSALSADLEETLAARATPPEPPPSSNAHCNTAVREEVWLLGQPPLWRFLEFVQHSTTGGAQADTVALTAQWCAANDYYQELEVSEAGVANSGRHRELDPELLPLADNLKRLPQFRRAFDTVQTGFGMVDLDCLIVRQKHVTWTFVESLMRRIGPHPDREALFHTCLPVEGFKPSVQVCRIGSHRYSFRSDSTDLRHHETTILAPSQVPGYTSYGALAAVVGVVVGFGYPFLSAVRVGNRMLLDNGYHRACALRALGLTHAPCIVQSVSRIDELDLAVGARVVEDAELYFESARPPLLKDFFDPKIRKVLPVAARTHVVDVSVDVKYVDEDPIQPQ